MCAAATDSVLFQAAQRLSKDGASAEASRAARVVRAMHSGRGRAAPPGSSVSARMSGTGAALPALPGHPVGLVQLPHSPTLSHKFSHSLGPLLHLSLQLSHSHSLPTLLLVQVS